jgi:hypothetical protein
MSLGKRAVRHTLAVHVSVVLALASGTSCQHQDGARVARPPRVRALATRPGPAQQAPRSATGLPSRGAAAPTAIASGQSAPQPPPTGAPAPPTLPQSATQLPPSNVTPPQTALPLNTPPKANSELSRAEDWLAALRRRDVTALSAQSRYPFELRDTGEQGHCPARRTAPDAARMAAAVDCLLDDELLTSLLQAGSSVGLQALPDGFLSSWAARWRGELRPDEKPVTVHLSRNDASLTLILLVARDGVGGLLKTGTDATLEVALAKQWIEALRRRDLPALNRATRYPFELRQSDPTPGCEARTALRVGDLRAAIECLLADDAFSRALSLGSSNTIEAGPARGYVPEFFEGWANADRGGLWPTLLHLETSEDVAIDLMLLVAKDGVRAVWKRTGPLAPDPPLRRGVGVRPRSLDESLEH